jgi:hypothetical protein
VSDSLPAVPANSIFGLMRSELSAQERGKLQIAAMERVEDDRFHRPVPLFLTQLPFGGDSDEITDRIAAAILLADDPDAAQNDNGTVSGKELVGEPVTVWDLRVLPGEKPGGWGAFLLLDVTVGDDERHVVANTGAKQAVVRLARAWADGELPCKGAFSTIPGTGNRGEPAIAFICEPAF